MGEHLSFSSPFSRESTYSLSSPFSRERRKVRVAIEKSKVNKARILRRNMTDAERILWNKLRNKQLVNHKFRRQHPLDPYVLDFYCPSKRLVIEIDGGQHYTSEGKTRDKSREKYLNQLDIEVIRYSDRGVLTKVDAVLQDILKRIKEW
jgi:very-short-patch-repair endonuclease